MNEERVMAAEHYDLIVIGTGAGGGTLAHTVAPSGKRVPQRILMISVTVNG